MRNTGIFFILAFFSAFCIFIILTTSEFHKTRSAPFYLRLDPASTLIRIYSHSIDDISTLKQAHSFVAVSGLKVLAVCNGGIFDENFQPLGLLVQNGQVCHELNQDIGNGNFFLAPNGVFFIRGKTPEIMPTSKYAKLRISPDWAIQSGPLLVVDAKVNNLLPNNPKSKYTRNGIGVDENNNVILLFAPDPVSLYDFAVYARDTAKARHALYLDGAVSGLLTDYCSININREYATIILFAALQHR